MRGDGTITWKSCRRPIFGLLSLCFFLITPPIEASKPAGTFLVIRGDSAASSSLKLPADVIFDLDKMEIQTKGSYVVWQLVYKVRAKGHTFQFPAAGALHVPAFERADSRFGPISLGSKVKYAGDYRLYLVTDGPTTIRVPAEGLKRTTRIRPSTPVRSKGSLFHLAESSHPVAGTSEMPVRLTDTTFTIMSFVSVDENLVAAAVQGCMVPEERPLCTNQPGDGSAGSTFVSHRSDVTNPDSSSRYMWTQPRGFPGPGKYLAQWKVGTVAVEAKVIALTLTFDW